MAFTGNYICVSYLKELFEAKHDFNNDTFKIALYDNNASFTRSTTAYTSDNEISGTNYSAGGGTLTVNAPTTSGRVAYVDFDDYTFSSLTASGIRGGLIYNDTLAGKNAIAVLDFGQDKSRTAADLVITFPTADALNAILRLETPD